MSHSNAKIVGETALTELLLPARVRKAMKSTSRHHPSCKLIPDVEKQRLQPRFAFIEDRWFPLWHSLRTRPQYAKYFEVWSDAPSVLSHKEVLDKVRRMDIYEASTFFGQQKFADEHFSQNSRSALYTDLWLRSFTQKPTDLETVLVNISTWIRIGIFPCNLFSEAFRLLPGSISLETVILCVYYRGFASKLSLPADDVIFPIAEELLLDEMLSLSMSELNAISTGYFMSYRPFDGKQGMLLTTLLMKRFLDLLPDHRFDSHCQCVLKMLKLNTHWNLTDMNRLLPTLEASGFFEFCQNVPTKYALHQLKLVFAFLLSRQFKDDELLLKCVETLNSLIKRDASGFRSKDLAQAWYAMLSIGGKPDSEMFDFMISFFTDEVNKGEFGISIQITLRGCALAGIYPLKLIDAFFSSEALMLLDNGHLPGMTGVSTVNDPFRDLLRFDTELGIMCPEYKGSRIPEKVHFEMSRAVKRRRI